MKTVIIAITFIFMMVSAQAQNLDHLTVEKEISSFGNLQKADHLGNIVYSAQPDENTIKMLKEQGFDMIVSVRYDDEKVDFDERKVVEENGMSFIRIPYFKGSIDDKVRNVDDAGIAELSKMLNTATMNGSKVFMHCQSGQRASAALGSLLARDYGYSKEQAIDIAAKAGLTSK
ncbi:MAG: sulfur transferase domain-containing protein, partial [Emcibacteraceae bacterium]|nr:sulfur transferase domain-containing protein [Emcibacteraceae bacterium]